MFYSKTVAAIVVFFAFFTAVSILYPDPPASPSRMDLVTKFQALNKSCFILGASGESGKGLLKELIKLQPFQRIVLIGRRKLDYEDEELKKLEQRIINFDEIEKHKTEFEGFDVGYCCLGTTRGVAGAAGFVKIEHDYVVGSAKLAKEAGTEHFHLVSSGGVDEHSWFLYQSTKGRTDREVSEMGFRRASIYRPAMLMVDRTEKRRAEAFVLAKAMVMNTVQEEPAGAEIINNQRIHALAKSLP